MLVYQNLLFLNEIFLPGKYRKEYIHYNDKAPPSLWTLNILNLQLGRTECIDNELNPTFKEKIFLDYIPYEEQNLIIKVWDIDDYENDISKADFLGEIGCTLGELVDSGSKFYKALRYKGSDYGKIFVSIISALSVMFSSLLTTIFSHL